MKLLLCNQEERSQHGKNDQSRKFSEYLIWSSSKLRGPTEVSKLMTSFRLNHSCLMELTIVLVAKKIKCMMLSRHLPCSLLWNFAFTSWTYPRGTSTSYSIYVLISVFSKTAWIMWNPAMVDSIAGAVAYGYQKSSDLRLSLNLSSSLNVSIICNWAFIFFVFPQSTVSLRNGKNQGCWTLSSEDLDFLIPLLLRLQGMMLSC